MRSTAHRCRDPHHPFEANISKAFRRLRATGRRNLLAFGLGRWDAAGTQIIGNADRQCLAVAAMPGAWITPPATQSRAHDPVAAAVETRVRKLLFYRYGVCTSYPML